MQPQYNVSPRKTPRTPLQTLPTPRQEGTSLNSSPGARRHQVRFGVRRRLFLTPGRGFSFRRVNRPQEFVVIAVIIALIIKCGGQAETNRSRGEVIQLTPD